jgi:hypothetical protein
MTLVPKSIVDNVLTVNVAEAFITKSDANIKVGVVVPLPRFHTIGLVETAVAAVAAV